MMNRMIIVALLGMCALLGCQPNFLTINNLHEGPRLTTDFTAPSLSGEDVLSSKGPHS